MLRYLASMLGWLVTVGAAGFLGSCLGLTLLAIAAHLGAVHLKIVADDVPSWWETPLAAMLVIGTPVICMFVAARVMTRNRIRQDRLADTPDSLL